MYTSLFIHLSVVLVCGHLWSPLQLVLVGSTLTTWPHAGTGHQSYWWGIRSTGLQWTCGQWVSGGGRQWVSGGEAVGEWGGEAVGEWVSGGGGSG